jgi:hypothetical protein
VTALKLRRQQQDTDREHVGRCLQLSASGFLGKGGKGGR